MKAPAACKIVVVSVFARYARLHSAISKRACIALVCTSLACCATGIMTGCRNKATVPEQYDEEYSAPDSAELDSIVFDSGETEDTPIPRAADELFDDFIFNFISNTRLQMSRINFPLVRHYREGRTDTITSRQWEPEHFFMERDYYTVIADNETQLERMKDTTVCRAVVEKIYLESGYVTRYVFNRTGGKWMLTAVCDTTRRGTPADDFLSFYYRFATDTLFQTASIENPLKVSMPDPDDDFSVVDGFLMPEQWASFAPELPHGMIYNIVYGEPPKSRTEKLFVIMGISNGMETDLTFRKREGRWRLTQLAI
ncbi:MAG: DUF4348 domain-containing protein [Prevotella sp.]|nr:DUF4348 domain-containing protein [Prevotella sp.]